jgi:hypothetical protein
MLATKDQRLAIRKRLAASFSRSPMRAKESFFRGEGPFVFNSLCFLIADI